MALKTSSFLAFTASFRIKVCFILTFCVAWAGLVTPSFAYDENNPKYASLVMDADTGLILSQTNASKHLHPASLTKVMTLLMLFEAMDKSQISLSDRIPISQHAASMAPSKLGLKPGSSISVRDAIYAIVTKSANDIAAAVAEKLGGNESTFCRQMTARAHEIGMNDTTFVNASGLHDPRQITSARDMARLARVVINDYPTYYRYFSTKNFVYKGQNIHNHNHLMESYKGMDGMKTGYTIPSGFNLVASAVQNHHRLIGVVFGGRTTKTRDATMASLLDAGFERIGDMRVAAAPEAAAPTAPAVAPPLPRQKPQILMTLASLNNLSPAGSADAVPEQGDYDPTENRATTATADAGPSDVNNDSISSIATASDLNPADTTASPTSASPEIIVASADPRPQSNSAAYLANSKSSWGIQIGAFASRAATDQAIQRTLKSLPTELAQANPIIMPLRTDDGFLFRGRINGYSREQAFKACTYLSECMPVPPQE